MTIYRPYELSLGVVMPQMLAKPSIVSDKETSQDNVIAEDKTRETERQCAEALLVIDRSALRPVSVQTNPRCSRWVY